jgi:putative transposase
MNMRTDSPGTRIWQRGYFERVVRTEEELEAIRSYIFENPAAWTEDPENPARSEIVASAPWDEGRACPAPTGQG